MFAVENVACLNALLTEHIKECAVTGRVACLLYQVDNEAHYAALLAMKLPETLLPLLEQEAAHEDVYLLLSFFTCCFALDGPKFGALKL